MRGTGNATERSTRAIGIRSRRIPINRTPAESRRTVPDGIGNACQCGDVTGNGVCNGQDANAVQRIALGQPSPTFGQHCPNADPPTPCPYCP